MHWTASDMAGERKKKLPKNLKQEKDDCRNEKHSAKEQGCRFFLPKTHHDLKHTGQGTGNEDDSPDEIDRAHFKTCFLGETTDFVGEAQRRTPKCIREYAAAEPQAAARKLALQPKWGFEMSSPIP